MQSHIFQYGGMLIIFALSLACTRITYSEPKIILPETIQRPAIACTGEELGRLRATYNSKGPGHAAIAKRISRADRAMKTPVEFPPRGGQHNQWYQCDKCQFALKQIDDTHHKCPMCNTIYSGEPYDDVIFGRKHNSNLRNMLDAAWAYAITGKKKYAEFAAGVLSGYGERYEKYPYHGAARDKGHWTQRAGGHLFEQTLNEAASMARHIAPAYDLIHDSGVLTPEDHDKIRTGLIIPILKNIDKNRMGKSNWQTYHNAGMLWGGGAIGDVSWIKKAVENEFNGFLTQMRISVSEEGMWHENSWAYHCYTLAGLVKTAEGARRLGIDLWSHPTLRKMFILPLSCIMPDGRMPRFGDDIGFSLKSASPSFEAAYFNYGEPAILTVLPARESWESVFYGRDTGRRVKAAPQKSILLKSSGHAICRTNGKAGLTAALTFGPYGGFHGHFDKLSFVFYGYGRELGVDPGRARSQAYRLPIHRNWYKATISHNTVLVNKHSQLPASGVLNIFKATDEYVLVAAECSKAWPTTNHKRIMLLTPTYLLVLDELASKEPASFDWVYHNKGLTVSSSPAATETAVSGFQGSEYIKQTRSVIADDIIRVTFAGKTVTTHLTMATGKGTTVLIGDGVGASVKDRVPMVMANRKGTLAQFAVVLEPVKTGAPVTVKSVTSKKINKGLEIYVVRENVRDTISIRESGKLISVYSGDREVLTAKAQ